MWDALTMKAMKDDNEGDHGTQSKFEKYGTVLV